MELVSVQAACHWGGGQLHYRTLATCLNKGPYVRCTFAEQKHSLLFSRKADEARQLVTLHQEYANQTNSRKTRVSYHLLMISYLTMIYNMYNTVYLLCLCLLGSRSSSYPIRDPAPDVKISHQNDTSSRPIPLRLLISNKGVWN